MTEQQWDDLYRKVFDAYDDAGKLNQEYLRSTLGDALDHLIYMKNSPLIQSGL